MKIMRSYGSGLVEMENLLSRANEAFIAYLDKNEGKEINIAELLGDYVCTVTTVLVCIGDQQSSYFYMYICFCCCVTLDTKENYLMGKSVK